MNNMDDLNQTDYFDDMVHLDKEGTKVRNEFREAAREARQRDFKRTEKEFKEEQIEQERVRKIFAGKISGEPRDIHPCGMEILKREHFHIEDSVDISWSEERFFALDDIKERFYFDPFPEKEHPGGLDFRIYHVSAVLDVTVYENQKYVEGSHSEESARLARTVGVEITMDDPDRPVIYIPCMPYAVTDEKTYQMRYNKAVQILEFLKDAKQVADEKKKILSKYIKPAVCSHCGAPVEGKTAVCVYCGLPPR